jgi:fructose-1-phosphate kinase PfkB-like protein
VEGRYPVGSGDAFLAGLATALAAGDELDRALRLATGAGAANALVPGAGELDPAEARRIADTVAVTPV